MASSPFALVTSSPADDAIVSQFPTLDRSDKDVIQSWLLTDHNHNGGHNYVQLLQIGVADGSSITASAPTPAASTSAIYRHTDGSVVVLHNGAAAFEYLGVPPGAIVAYAGLALPQGWFWCDGTTFNRTTDARLFTAIGTTYGTGNGTTTATLPDLNGRYIAGVDRTGTNRLVEAGFGGIASSAGDDAISISTTNLPALSLSVSTNVAGGGSVHVVGSVGINDSKFVVTSATAAGAGTNVVVLGLGSSSLGIAANIDLTPSFDLTGLAASGTASGYGTNARIVTVPPSLALYYIIKR